MNCMQVCKLCGVKCNLQDSHIIPKFLYKYMINITDDNLTQFMGGLNLWQKSNRQLKETLLCSDCEQRLGNNETAFSDIFKNINLTTDRNVFTYGELGEADYNELLKKGFTKKDIDNELIKSPIASKIDVIRFFAISYIFRELVRNKRNNNSYKIHNSDIDRIRNFLMGSDNLRFMLNVHIHNDKPEFNLFSTVMVMDGLPDWKHYVFYIPNMLFHVAINTKEESNKLYKTSITPSNLFHDEIDTLKLIKKLQSDAKIAANLTES